MRVTYPPIWTPQPIFRDTTVFVVGGGPSLRNFDFEALRGKTVVVVNEFVRRVPWAALLFFGDAAWYRRRKAEVKAFKGLVVTHARGPQIDLGADKILRVTWDILERKGASTEFPPQGHPVLRWGPTSGHKAVSLCVSCAAARVVMLGFDCRVDEEGHSHGHDAYQHRGDAHMKKSWLPGWTGWRDAAARRGTTIVNATPGTDLTEFPLVPLEQELAA